MLSRVIQEQLLKVLGVGCFMRRPAQEVIPIPESRLVWRPWQEGSILKRIIATQGPPSGLTSSPVSPWRAVTDHMLGERKK